ncbi:MAG: class I SAM-dependent methyltransferase [Candidatus Hodarchaeota archaeon]
MKNNAIQLEEIRLTGINKLDDYDWYHERHRVFPAVFENRMHKNILDISAGMGIVGKRINDNYSANLICNDISPTCLRSLKKLGLNTVSFDLDVADKAFPFPDEHFDAIISLATIEHLIHIDHFLNEIHRIMKNKGYLYLSAPNYNGLLYLIPLLITGKTFHDPLDVKECYEFYAHFRYFTYQTLLDYVSSIGFIPDSVYLPIPENSSNYKKLKAKSKVKALIFRTIMKSVYYLLSPRWASEPIICFQKNEAVKSKFRKVIL